MIPKSIKFYAHSQEVLGLSSSPDQDFFVSGGRDSKVLAWSIKSNTPLMKANHEGPVRAVCWSQKQYGMFFSGGT